MSVISVNLDHINLDDINFYDDDSKTIINGRLLPCYYRYKQQKAFKKEISKEVMFVVWYPARWWDWCGPKYEKKEKEPISIDKN